MDVGEWWPWWLGLHCHGGWSWVRSSSPTVAVGRMFVGTCIIVGVCEGEGVGVGAVRRGRLSVCLFAPVRPPSILHGGVGGLSSRRWW